MVHIELPFCPVLRLFSYATVTLSSLLILAIPATLSDRLLLVGLVLAGWLLAWRRYLRTRPISIRTDVKGQIECVLANGDLLPVTRLRVGSVGSRLIAARLWTNQGRGLDLFVSSAILPVDVHWQLRRLLLDWHQVSEPDDLRGT